MRFVTDPREARVVSMKDGTRYDVGPGGSFVVTKDEHVSELANGNHDYYSNAVTFGVGKGLICPCGHVAWAWQDECPRCGQSLP